MQAITTSTRSIIANRLLSSEAALFCYSRHAVLLDADLRNKVLQDLLNNAANVGILGEVFDAAETLRLVCKDWAVEVRPMMRARVDLLLSELSQLEGLEGISEHTLCTDRNVDLSAALTNAEVDRWTVNMLLAVVYSNRAFEGIRLCYCNLPIKQLKGLEPMSYQSNLQAQSLCAFDSIVIGALIKSNGALQELNLYNNQIGDEGAIAIGKGLKSNRVMTSIVLSYNQIGDRGAIGLAKDLRHNGALTKLRLQANKIGDDGAIALADGLNHNRALKCLFLGGNKLTAAGKQAVKNAWAASGRDLQRLHL